MRSLAAISNSNDRMLIWHLGKPSRYGKTAGQNLPREKFGGWFRYDGRWIDIRLPFWFQPSITVLILARSAVTRGRVRQRVGIARRAAPFSVPSGRDSRILQETPAGGHNGVYWCVGSQPIQGRSTDSRARQDEDLGQQFVGKQEFPSVSRLLQLAKSRFRPPHE